MTTGVLYIVPTPVGNLGDMTPRAISILKSVSLILCEDTRTSAPLLKHFGIATLVSSHHKYNEHQSVDGVIALLQRGEDVALISDAGTPGISDPGFMLSRECRRNDITVQTLPGATAFVPALVNSGLPCERFLFEGFLPPKKGRKTRLVEISDSQVSTIIYESPLRLVKTLEQLAEYCGGDRDASVSREISKVHESTIRGTLDELVQHYTSNVPKGEIVIIVAPAEKNNSAGSHRNKYKDENPEQ